MSDGYTDTRGRWTACPILFPDARTFRDLFSEARFATGMPTIDPQDPTCWRYVTGTRANVAAPHWHRTKRRYIKTRDGKFWCHGIGVADFMSCNVRPLPGIVAKVEETLISRAGSFEIIQHSGGVLVTLRDNHGIGSRWLALLDAGESLLSLMSTEDHAAYATARLWEQQAQSCVDGETVGRTKAESFGIPVIEGK
jgi:hypothetical protein